jgi:D-aminoacyl-tRNA deacylase
VRILVASKHDIASLSIRDILTQEFDFRETNDVFDGAPVFSCGSQFRLLTSSRDLISTDHLESQFPADVYIFCSRHRAESKRPALLVHSTGNLGSEALFGGSPYSLSVSCASLVAVALRTLRDQREALRLDDFDVTLEATHHGPTNMATPLLFVELGSDEAYWEHQEGARAVATAAMACLRAPFDKQSYIGFGGTHYASKFNKIVLEKDMRVGHIAPKYAMNDIPESVIRQMISRSKETVRGAIIDWKGTNQEQRNHLLPILDNLGMELIRDKDL